MVLRVSGNGLLDREAGSAPEWRWVSKALAPVHYSISPSREGNQLGCWFRGTLQALRRAHAGTVLLLLSVDLVYLKICY